MIDWLWFEPTQNEVNFCFFSLVFLGIIFEVSLNFIVNIIKIGYKGRLITPAVFAYLIKFHLVTLLMRLGGLSKGM